MENYVAGDSSIPQRRLSSETIAKALSGTPKSTASPSLEAKNISLVRKAEEANDEDLKQKDGSLWECVNKIKMPEGSIYRYRLKNKFDPLSYPDGSDQSGLAISEMNKLCHPAVEWTGVLASSKRRWEFGEREFMPWVSQRARDVVKELGYKMEFSSEGVFLEFPDKALIESRWISIMDRHPDWNLKKLTIKLSGQIAGDREFIDAFCEYDVLLSTGREFVHDHQVHMLSKIEFIVDHPKEYVESREKLIQGIRKISEIINVARDWLTTELSKDHLSSEDPTYLARLKKNLEQADVIPAIYADIFAAVPSPEDMEEMLGELLGSRPTEMFAGIKSDVEVYSGYLTRSFPDRDISMPWLCDEIVKILDKVEKKGCDTQIV